MGEADALAHLREQAQAGGEIQPRGVAIAIERLAVDELHDEIGLAEPGDASVEEAGEGGMLERGQDLALGPELRDQRRIRQP